MTRRSSKTKRSPEASIAKQTQALARTVGVPEHQIGRGDLVMVETKVANDADFRERQRSKQTQTVRRTTKIQQLVKAEVVSPGEARVCEWYLETWTAAYETSAITADYERAGGGSSWRVYSHSAKYAQQEDARRAYASAKASMSPSLVGFFEYVVLQNGAVGRRSLAFRVALAQLANHLEREGISTSA